MENKKEKRRKREEQDEYPCKGYKNSLQLAAAGKDVRDCLIIFIFII